VEKEIGRGGVGIVYLARDRHLHSRPVVVKVLQEGQGADPWFQKKFRQEIEALTRIDHPGVVGVLDVGETPDGKPFLVMQYVEGVTLRSVISSQGMGFRRAANIAGQIGHALTAAHQRGVYHRDLKPENIMLQRAGDGEEPVKLIDFGIATVRDARAELQDVDTTRVAGSHAYMAPEQLWGKPSAQSDIYAFGVIAYEILTGEKPFRCHSPAELLEKQKQGVQVKPKSLRPDLPEAAQAAILKAVAFRPEDRFARAREFGDALAAGLTAAAGPAAGSVTTRSESTAASLRLEMASVLFLDVVGFSGLPTDQQPRLIRQLQEKVRGTRAFRLAQARGQLIPLPTGDGMALVFFENPETAVECAVEIARSLSGHQQLRLRMGVHSGPVYRIADINTNRNVVGGGINVAQRVMACGQAGHILMSSTAGETLLQLSRWAPYLLDLGEHSIGGRRLRLYNLSTGEVGNPERPRKLPGLKGSSRTAWYAGALVTTALILGLALWRLPRRTTPPPEPTSAAPVAAAPESPPPAPKPAPSFDSYLRAAVERLFAKVDRQRSLRVLIGRMNFADTEFSSALGGYVSEKLAAWLPRLAPRAVIVNSRAEPAPELVVRGSYREAGDQIGIDLTLAEFPSGVARARATASIPKSLLPAGLAVAPPWLKEVQGVLRDLEATRRPPAMRLSAEPGKGRGPIYFEGEPIDFWIQAARECYVRLLSIDSQGSVTELFPNKSDRDNYVPPNRLKAIPDPGNPLFSITAGAPFGAEIIRVIASSTQFADHAASAWPFDKQIFRALGRYKGSVDQHVPSRGGTILAEDHFVITILPASASRSSPPQKR